MWYIVTMLTTRSLSDQALGIQIVASCVVLALLTLGSWIALPHLPAGRAFASRGIRTTWRTKVTQPS